MMQPLDHGVELASPPGFLEAAVAATVLTVIGVALYLWIRARTGP